MTYRHPLDPGGNPVAKQTHEPLRPIPAPDFVTGLWSGEITEAEFREQATLANWTTSFINAEINAYKWSCKFHKETYGKEMNK